MGLGVGGCLLPYTVQFPYIFPTGIQPPCAQLTLALPVHYGWVRWVGGCPGLGCRRVCCYLVGPVLLACSAHPAARGLSVGRSAAWLVVFRDEIFRVLLFFLPLQCGLPKHTPYPSRVPFRFLLLGLRGREGGTVIKN